MSLSCPYCQRRAHANACYVPLTYEAFKAEYVKLLKNLRAPDAASRLADLEECYPEHVERFEKPGEIAKAMGVLSTTIYMKVG